MGLGVGWGSAVQVAGSHTNKNDHENVVQIHSVSERFGTAQGDGR